MSLLLVLCYSMYIVWLLWYVFAVMWTDLWLLDYLPSSDTDSPFNIALGSGGMFDS